MKYLVGSKMLGLKNTKDTDYVIISEDYEYKRIYSNGEDILYRSKENIITSMLFNRDINKFAGSLILNYQYDADIIGQDFPIEYHLLDHKEELINLLKVIVKNKLLNVNKRVSIKGGKCSKTLYHIAYNVFILQNNSPIITEEQKQII